MRGKAERASLAATTAVAACVVCFSCCVVLLALGFLWMTQSCAGTIKWLGFGERDIDKWIDELEKFAIRRFLVEVIGFIADGITLPRCMR